MSGKDDPTKPQRNKAKIDERLGDVAHAADNGGVREVRIEILEVKDASNGECRQMPDEHLRVGRAVDRTFAVYSLQTVRDGPREERHVQLGCDGLQQVVDALFFGRVDGDDRMPRLDERFQVVSGVGVRHVRAGAAWPFR